MAKTAAALTAWQTASLEGLDLVGLLIDGVDVAEHCLIVALGIAADGHKHALGLWDGSTENARVCQDLPTNAAEELISRVRIVKRNVKRWRGGQMMLRWVAAGILEAVKFFRRVKGYADMPTLVNALRTRDRQVGLVTAESDRQVAWSLLQPPLNFNSRRDIAVIAQRVHSPDGRVPVGVARTAGRP